MPSSARLRTTSSTSPTSSGSSAEVISSSSRIFGSIATARAMPTRCCWPPESCGGQAVELVGEPDAPQPVLGDRARLGLRLAAHLAQAEHDVLGGRQMREQVEHLEDHAGLGAHRAQLALAAPPPAAAALAIADLVAVDLDRAAVVGLEEVDAAQQRGLAAAGRADDGDHLAARARRDRRREHERRAEGLLRRPRMRTTGWAAGSAMRHSRI